MQTIPKRLYKNFLIFFIKKLFEHNAIANVCNYTFNKLRRATSLFACYSNCFTAFLIRIVGIFLLTICEQIKFTFVTSFL